MRLIDADGLQELFNVTSSALLSDVELSKDIEHVVRACLMVAEMISDAPTVDAEPVRHGHWEVVDEAEPRRWGCSNCRCLSWHEFYYCPKCGAKMDEEVNENETD